MAISKPTGASPTRRRRRPEDARSEILSAARELLAGGDLAALTVSAVMARTTLSRKSFYVYFDDIPALVLALVRPLRAGADAGLAAWEQADEPVVAGRAALAAAAEMYREHGALLAIVVRSPTSDPGLLAAREQLTEPLVRIAERLLRAGPSPAPDPRAAAIALATMNIHTLLDHAPGASDAKLAALVDALATIWERAVLASG